MQSIFKLSVYRLTLGKAPPKTHVFRRIMFFSCCMLGLLAQAVGAADSPSVSSTRVTANDFALVQSGSAATIVYSSADAKVVEIAAGLFADDVQRVSSVRPAVATSVSGVSGPLVLIGTIGKSPILDSLIAAGKVDVSKIQGGWERYRIEVIKDPFAGVSQALVIAGSDRRGTAYGVFSLSEAMGVSPWYWWADAAVQTMSSIYVDATPFTSDQPTVRYRGIFINDEDWGISPWAKKNFDTTSNGGVGDIGPKTYAKVFELLLRLKANYIWPAMHPVTKAFNHYADDPVVADNYAIVMGSSHAEPMLRDNDYEWYNDIDPATITTGTTGKTWSSEGSYNYSAYPNDPTNLVYRYWDARAASNGIYENVWPLGKRGIGDSAMPEGSNNNNKAGWLNTIFTAQRQILSTRVNGDVTKVPQMFTPYKEVLDIYNTGLVNVPDDVTLGWPDDNFGYIRRLSNSTEQLRSGGGGVYYHVSYWGSPLDYLWVCTTPPALIWEEMTKAYAYNCGRVWILNVGDIKPSEIDMEFFLRLAWNVNRYDENAQTTWLTEWATREFGAANAASIASVLNDYYQLGYTRKPEHMNWKDTDPLSPSGPYPLFSNVHYGDESAMRLAKYADVLQRANAIYSALPSSQQTAFYETVLYPIRGADGMNRKYLNAGRAYVASAQGRNSVATRNAASQQGYSDILSETTTYNQTNASGKWNYMMSAAPHGLAGQPTLPTVPTLTTGTLGIAIEGNFTPSYLPAPTATNTIILNAATSGTVTSPMVVTTIGGLAAIYTPNGTGTAATAGAAGSGWATYTFNVATTGTYTLACEVNCPTANDDSFFIQFDTATSGTWNNLSNNGVWSWATYGTIPLTSGTHTLKVNQREDGAAMAAMKLTSGSSTIVEDSLLSGFQFPEFNVFTRRSYFLDLFNTGTNSVSWQITTANPWILISKTSGSTTSEDRLQVSIDWSKVPHTGNVTSSLTVASGGKSLVIPVNVWIPADALPVTSAFVEDNHAVAVETEHYSGLTSGTDAAWVKLPGLGSGDGAMFVSPPTAASRAAVSDIVNTSPCLQYNVYLRQSGTVTVAAEAIPTLPINTTMGLRYAVSFDNNTPQIVDMSRPSGSGGGDTWSRSVLRNRIEYTTTHTLSTAGAHTLKVWMADPGVVLDRFVISSSALPYTVQGPPETVAVSHGTLTVNAGDTYSTQTGQVTVYDALSNKGTVNASSGSLTFSGNVVNDNTLRLYGGAQLSVSGTFVNNGILDMMTWNGTLPVNFVNNGTVLDRSAVRVREINVAGTDIQISIESYLGHNYQLQRRDSLTSATWQNVGEPQQGTNSVHTFTDPGPTTAPSRFYRVLVSP
jgi:hypothetical protein